MRLKKSVPAQRPGTQHQCTAGGGLSHGARRSGCPRPTPNRFLEIRGTVESVEDDPGAGFYRSLQQRYGMDYPVRDADVRVIITVRPDRYVAVRSGAVEVRTAASHSSCSIPRS